MPISVICPNCKEENIGSALFCKKCQSSLAGILRTETAVSPIDKDTSPQTQEPVAEPKAWQEDPNQSLIGAHSVMLDRIMSWGRWSLGLGALHLFTSGFLSAPWGILLIMVGLGSFFFKTASMFVIYSITLAWAALSNLLSFEITWAAFSIYQFYLAYQVFQQYKLFRGIETDYRTKIVTNLPESDRADRFFPWLGPIFGCSSIFGFILLIVAAIVIVVASEGKTSPPDFLGFIEGMMVNLGILGASIGLASLLSKYKLKALSIIGIIGGVLTIISEFVLTYLP